VCGLVLASAFVGTMIGLIAGVDWAERRRVRDLRANRADISAAFDRNTR
jgi:hypothetical protein